VLREIARDVAAICPNAWLFNYSNPMSCLVRAARTEHPARTVGLCHGTMNTQRLLAARVGATFTETTAQAAGVNHLTWIHDLCWGDRDVLAMLRQRGPEADERDPFSWSLFEVYGAFPAPGDRHVVEFYPGFFPHGAYQGGVLGVDRFPMDPVLRGGEARFEEMAAQARGEKPLDERLFHRAPGEHEQLMEIIRSIEGNAGEVFFANVPNEGAIPGIPPDAPVEVPIAFWRDGYQTRLQKPLPRGVVPLLAQRCLQQELNTAAALTGDRNLALQALLADGWVTSVADARRLMDELLETHKAHLPLFH
jgi:alpha-galactosidase